MRANFVNLMSSLAIGGALTFVPAFAHELGASDIGVGLIVGVYGATNMIAFFLFGRLSDTIGRKIVIMVGLALSTLSFILLAVSSGPITLFVFRAATGFTAGIYPAALTSYVWEKKRRLGSFTSYGSLGFALGSFMAGLMASYANMFLLGSFFFMISFMLSLHMPFIKELHLKVPIFPKEIIKKNIPIYLPYLLRHTGASMVWTILPLYLMTIGATKFWIGLIFGINPLAQFFIMPRIDKKNERSLFRNGLVISAIFFILISFTTTYYQVLPLMILIAVGWSYMYIGATTYLAKSNVEKATAVSLLNSTLHLALIFGSIMAGLISHFFSYTAVMYVAAFLSISAFETSKIKGARL